MATITLRHPGRQATCARRAWPASPGVLDAFATRVRAYAPIGVMSAVAKGVTVTTDPTGTNDRPTIRNQSPRPT